MNFGCLDAGILIFSPVRGFRPSVARRFEIEKVPNPTSRTSSPPFRDAVMASKTQSTAFVVSAFDKPAVPATFAIRSFLFTSGPLGQLVRMELRNVRRCRM